MHHECKRGATLKGADDQQGLAAIKPNTYWRPISSVGPSPANQKARTSIGKDASSHGIKIQVSDLYHSNEN
eukprot:2898905-Amphidinium_carterae.1